MGGVLALYQYFQIEAGSNGEADQGNAGEGNHGAEIQWSPRTKGAITSNVGLHNALTQL
jgi:hypothetical protein